MGIKGMDLIESDWFHERNSFWPGQATSLQFAEILHHTTSSFQDILVLKSLHHGNVLILDGVIQLTERDEFAYHEMIAHLPLFSHPNPSSVLVIGGGDGGAVREVLKHPSVETVVLCEIDQAVVQIAREYFKITSDSLSDPRVTVKFMDGAKFLEENLSQFDVIITDSSDPIGPAEALFEPAFYKAMNSALREGGIICTQGECMWLHADVIGALISSCREFFPVVQYAYASVPTYPSGQIGFILCAKDADTSMKHPCRQPHETEMATFKYYNPDIHQAAFILPQFARRTIMGK